MGTKTLLQRSEMGKELDSECDFNVKYNQGHTVTTRCKLMPNSGMMMIVPARHVCTQAVLSTQYLISRGVNGSRY